MKMKKRIKTILAAFLAAVILCTTVFAAPIATTLEVFYNNIKINIDGEIIIPKNVLGDIVDPFNYEGTIYVPARAVSEALGAEVAWDGDTQTVIITSGESRQAAKWFAPMLSLSVSAREASVFTGELATVDTNDFGNANRGKIVTDIPEADEPLELAKFTAEELIAGGAVKMTANFAYEGDDEYNIRFRVLVNQFQGHGITGTPAAAAGVLILWEDEDGTWWNIRRTAWGGPLTGGSGNPAAFTINKETAGNFAEQDFYIAVLAEVPFRPDSTDDQSGYVITYQAELPDHDGHFHSFEVLASTTVYIHASPSDDHECDDECDCDDHDHEHDDHEHHH